MTALFMLAILGTQQAYAFSDKQRNALNHVSQVIAVENFCKNLKAASTKISLLLVLHGVDLSNDDARQFVLSQADKHGAGLRAAGKEVGCLVAWSLYGPGGENVEGLLEKR